jgi:FkbM family methyltransferase
MKLIAFIASITRIRLVLDLLRILRNIRGLKRIVTLYDPNWIRKTIGIRLKEKIFKLKKNGYCLYLNVNDHIGYISYVNKKPFEQTVYELSKQYRLTKDDIILDIGANIGTASVPICAEIGCELIAIEASKGNAQLLSKNIYENRIKSKLYILALTANNSSEYLPLYIRNGNTGANSLLKKWNPSVKDSATELVPTATLDQLINDESIIRKIKLVKIDVEGAEIDVLTGGKKFLKLNRAPILMEYRLDATKKYLGRGMSELLDLMAGEYTVFALNDQLKEVYFDSTKSYENILFKKIMSE